jgi:hypothetical protein
MVLEKAAYWMAVGLLALFVSNHFAAKYENEVRCVASRSLATVEQVSGQATRLMATAEMMLGRGDTHLVRAETALVRAQTRMASVQTVIASHQAALAKVEAESARLVDLQELQGAVVCPRQNLRIAMPQLHGDGNI